MLGDALEQSPELLRELQELLPNLQVLARIVVEAQPGSTAQSTGAFMRRHALEIFRQYPQETLKMTARGATIPIAVDVVCGKKFDANEPAVLKDAGGKVCDFHQGG